MINVLFSMGQPLTVSLSCSSSTDANVLVLVLLGLFSFVSQGRVVLYESSYLTRFLAYCRKTIQQLVSYTEATSFLNAVNDRIVNLKTRYLISNLEKSRYLTPYLDGQVSDFIYGDA